MTEKARILVVDDQDTVCESVGKILRKRGCEVEQSFDGEKAIEMLDRERFDLVIADLMMPRISGMELLRYVKEHHPDVNVVMITGYASIDSAVEATKTGAAGYIPKPFTPEELTEAVEKALKERRASGPKDEPPRQAETAPAAVGKSEKIDVDEPFDRKEVASVTTETYADKVTRTDIPGAGPAADPNYCPKGRMVCKVFAKTGHPCKGACPIRAREQRQRAAKTGSALVAGGAGFIDVDAPFPYGEVAEATSPAIAATFGRSDLPVPAYGFETATQARSVLVIDDEPVVSNSVRRILGRRGHQVDEALEAEEGLKKIEANRYDLVLLDLRMPGKDGLELLSEIKERWPETKVVIVTGYASIESAIEATRRGAEHYLPKPFTPEELAGVAERVFEETAA